MMHHGHFETELFQRFPDLDLRVRNLCNQGDTPCFRPHPGRELQYAFKGAEKFVPEEFRIRPLAEGFYPTPDEWLTSQKADIVLAFFGFGSSFGGKADLPRFEREVATFLQHTKAQKYNGKDTPRIALIGPAAFQRLEGELDLPDGLRENRNLALYSKAMEEVAAEEGVLFVDLFTPTKEWFVKSSEALTIDGAQFNDRGYEMVAPLIADAVFGELKANADIDRKRLHAAVMEKNWMWENDYHVPNGVHVFGRRHRPYGPQNYPAEMKKVRELTALRDQLIHAICQGREFDLASEDAKTHPLPEVPTNYRAGRKNGEPEYLSGEETLKTISVPEGYQVELFADEQAFPSLANPVQMSFDNKGRLWVACMPSYPHWKPGDPKPDDKLIILEDTDGNGRADKETVFADGLHLPIGFELAPEGVYLSEANRFSLLVDKDGDDRADEREVLFYGFDDHDTHHAIGAFCADPSGAIYLSEGVFLHSNIETAYGTVRGTFGGFFRFDPMRRKLVRTAQLDIPNPWGTAFDQWGQPFFLFTSGPELGWMTQGEMKPRYGKNFRMPGDLLTSNQVRPTSGLEILSSRHFPDEVQGDLLINNTIGFRGMKQHSIADDGTGYAVKFRQDLLQSSNGNFRPADLEVAPDGSLYVIDWSNALIGHMQHNARDPFRDHVHGRVYRITYPSRPLVEPTKISGEPIDVLLENLKVPELRTRYRTRRELRGRDADEVARAVKKWVGELDETSDDHDRMLTEALWVLWGAGRLDDESLDRVLTSDDSRARAAAVRILRFNHDEINDVNELMTTAAGDEHGRVRLEAIIGASWIGRTAGEKVIAEAEKHPVDEWMKSSLAWSKASISGQTVEEQGDEVPVPEHVVDIEMFLLGREVFGREAHCAGCHQGHGNGMDPIYPPLNGSEWVTGDEERLIKIVMNGLAGEIVVGGKHYGNDTPPMTSFKDLIESDDEMAAVLTFVRQSWGNRASSVSPETVARIRAEVSGRLAPWTVEELLAAHPMAPDERKVMRDSSLSIGGATVSRARSESGKISSGPNIVGPFLVVSLLALTFFATAYGVYRKG